jgi:hypothetical protein
MKESGQAKFKTLSRHLPGTIEENYKSNDLLIEI